MLTSVERICSSLSHSVVTCDIRKCQIIFFKGRFSVDHLVSVAFVDLSETEHLFILKPVNVKTPLETKHEDLLYSGKVAFEHLQSTDWHLFETWTHSTKRNTKKHFQIKTQFEHPKKIKEIGKLSAPLEFPSVFSFLFLTLHLIILHSKYSCYS